MAPQRNTADNQQCQAAAHDSTAAAGPAARPQAATQQHQRQQRHAADVVLPLLLQHDSVRMQLRLVCSLLCCSKAVAAAVAEYCAGQLDIPRQATTTPQAQQAVAWLRKHARLVRSLDLLWDPDAAAHDVLGALVAAGPQTLALQSFKAADTIGTVPLLEQLPASFLTELEFYTNDGTVFEERADVARVSAALGRLTGLRALALDTLDVGPGEELPGLSALTQLTSLLFRGPVSDLQHAPPQLLELELPWWRHQQQQPLELQHLAAVTALTSLALDEGDVLPPNLLKLQVNHCRSAQPLLGLEQLQQLVCFIPAEPTTAQLQQLTSLTSLSLRYNQAGIEPASAAAWPLLPLQRLELQSAVLSAPVCQCLAQLSSLTSLQLQWCQLRQPASAQQLAAALRQLSGLQQLELSRPAVAEPDNADGAPSQGMQQLAQAVGSLQQLRELDISTFPQLAAAATGASNSFSALAGLTALSLARCCLSNAAVAAIVSRLPLLQSLDCTAVSKGCENEYSIPNAALPAIGRLHQLTCLRLDSMRVSNASLQQLCTGLTRLRELSLVGSGLSDAGMCHLTGLLCLQELGVPGCHSTAGDG